MDLYNYFIGKRFRETGIGNLPKVVLKSSKSSKFLEYPSRDKCLKIRSISNSEFHEVRNLIDQQELKKLIKWHIFTFQAMYQKNNILNTVHNHHETYPLSIFPHILGIVNF